MLIALLIAAATSSIDDSKIVDLTHPFDAKAIYWPTAKPFTWEKESWGLNAEGKWYTAARYAASEHGGTHLDAPIHFAEGGLTADHPCRNWWVPRSSSTSETALRTTATTP